MDAMDPFDLGCGVLAANTYQAGRADENITPVAPGAVWIAGASDPLTGFEANAYQYQGRVVIAYAGTDPSDGHDVTNPCR